MIRTTKPKLKLKPRKDKVSRLISILETGYYIHFNIGPLLGLKTLLKHEIRDIPAIKNYIKYRYEKQKKKREEELRKHLSKSNREFCEKRSIEEWMMSMIHFPRWVGIGECCELVKLLHSAVKRGLVDIVKYIIDIDPMLIHSRDEDGNNLATVAILHLNVFKYIVTHPLGTGLKKTNKFSSTCPLITTDTTLLIHALRRKSLYVAKWIIEYVVELWSQNEENLKKYAHIEDSLDTYLNCIYEDETALNIILKSFCGEPFRGFKIYGGDFMEYDEYILHKEGEKLFITKYNERTHTHDLIISFPKDVLSLPLPDSVTNEEDMSYRQANCSLDMMKSCLESPVSSCDEVLIPLYIRAFKTIVSKIIQQYELNLSFEDGKFIYEPGYWEKIEKYDGKWTRQFPSEDSDEILRYYSDKEDTEIFWPSIASRMYYSSNRLLQYIGLKVYILCKDIVKLLIQNGAKIPREKIDTFHYMTKWFDDVEFKTYINICDDGMVQGQIDERFTKKYSSSPDYFESYSDSDYYDLSDY